MKQNSCVGISKMYIIKKNKVHMSLRLIETLTQISINFIVFFYIPLEPRSPFCRSCRQAGTKKVW